MKEKLSLLTELIKFARCDHKVREQEHRFLLTIAKSINVSKDDFDYQQGAFRDEPLPQ